MIGPTLFLLLGAVEAGAFGTFVDADNPCLQYTGRVDLSNPKAVRFHYGGSSVRTRFEGTSLALRFLDHAPGEGNTIGVRIDGGSEMRFVLKPNADCVLQVAAGLRDKVHDLLVYRRSDTFQGQFEFKGLVLDKGCDVRPAPRRPRRRIEYFGDSVSSGALSDAVGFEGRSDDDVAYLNEHAILTNAYHSFAAIAARELKAEAHANAIGGLSLMNGHGWYSEKLVGLETTYDKMNPVPGEFTQWDFNRFTPHVVVLAIGQNDARFKSYSDLGHRRAWRQTYLALLRNLRAHYPKATFVLTLTLLNHEPGWDDALAQVADQFCRETGDKRVFPYRFRRSGTATPGHPRLKEQEEMARELAAFIRTLPDPWKDG